MISEIHTNTITTRIREIFPNSNPRVNAKKGGGAYGITTVVQLLNTDHYKDLGALLEETETDLTLKRSGTGISILIN